MKNVIQKTGMLSILLGLMTLLFFSSAAADSLPIKVGLLAPMTGPSPDWGKKQIVGMELAVEKINLRGGVNGTPVEMFALDTGGMRQRP
jgi:branched-chain amino acid transport system substrate-binding protein